MANVMRYNVRFMKDFQNSMKKGQFFFYLLSKNNLLKIKKIFVIIIQFF